MHLDSISDFASGFGYCENNNISYMKENFFRIKTPLNYMKDNTEIKVFDILKELIFRLFNLNILPTFITFCTSKECNYKVKDAILSFLIVGARGFDEIEKEDFKNGMIEAAENFKTNGNFSKKDISIFKKINRYILKKDVERINMSGEF